MISLKLNEEQADTLTRVIDILLVNQIQGKMERKHLNKILKNLSKNRDKEKKKFCSHCFQTHRTKITISKDDTKCWNCGRSEEGNYFGKTEFWITD